MKVLGVPAIFRCTVDESGVFVFGKPLDQLLPLLVINDYFIIFFKELFNRSLIYGASSDGDFYDL